MINDLEKRGLDVVIQPRPTPFTVLTCSFAEQMILGCSLVAPGEQNDRDRPATTSSTEQVGRAYSILRGSGVSPRPTGRPR
jgi:hypothetical protein